MVVEGRREVDDHDVVVGEVDAGGGVRGRLGDEDISAERLDGQIHAREGGDAGGMRAGRVDDDRGGDGTACGRDARDTSGVDRDPRHFGVSLDLHSSRLRRARESHRQAVRIRDAVTGAVAGRNDAVHAETGREPCGVFGRHQVDVNSEAALQVDVPRKGLDRRRGRQQEEIAVLMEIHRVADFVLEAFHEPDGFDRELDVLPRRKLMPNAAGVAAGRAGGKLSFALEHDDVTDAAPRQVVRRARAHAPRRR